MFWMKENRYFKGRDIRAVENPYEASFELAETFGDLAGSLKMSLKVLVVIMIYYSGVIIGVIIFNMIYGTNPQLNAFSVVFSMFMLFLTLFALRMIINSHTFLRDLGSNQELMMKIKTRAQEGNFDYIGEKELSVRDDPIKGLLGLIQSTSQYSKNISRAFKLIIGFIAVWYFAGILYLSVQFYRFGLEMDKWRFDWLLPGGIDITVSVLATILIILVRAKFEFAKKRYKAINYAMDSSPPGIPQGEDPIQRYSRYMVGQKGYEQLKERKFWTKGPYFDAEMATSRGMIFIKYLKQTPEMDDVSTFQEKVRAKAGKNKLNRAIIIFREDPKNPLSDQVYQHVLENPLKLKKEICNIQLVIEGEDKKYDLIPVVSF
jgi:hypothetical protein